MRLTKECFLVLSYIIGLKLLVSWVLSKIWIHKDIIAADRVEIHPFIPYTTFKRIVKYETSVYCNSLDVGIQCYHVLLHSRWHVRYVWIVEVNIICSISIDIDKFVISRDEHTIPFCCLPAWDSSDPSR